MKTCSPQTQEFQRTIASVFQARCSKIRDVLKTFAGLLAVLCLLSFSNANAGGNLLINGDFNSPASSASAIGWTTFTYGNAWAQHVLNPDSTTGYDGSYMFQAGVGDWWNGFASAYQTVQAVAGKPYTLTVASASQSWWAPYGEARLFFYDTTGTTLLLTVISNVCNYENNKPWALYTVTATAPTGAGFVKVELACPGAGGNMWFDNASLTSTYDAPTISSVTPDGSMLLQYSSAFSFTAASTSTDINAADIQLVLNGSNVSSGLVLSGGPRTWNVNYPGLKSNQLNTAVITVADANGIKTSSSFSFDTYNPVFLWEAEDWDFSNGQYINSPILSSSITANSYFGVIGAVSVDENETGGNPAGTGDGPQVFRVGDPMSTDASGDVLRQNYVDAMLSDPSIRDYSVGYFYGSEWVNYTRNFPAGTYYVIARLATGTAGSISLEKVTSGQGTSTQTTNHLGVFQMPGLGWGTYTYVPLTDTYSNLVSVNLSGVTTLRVNGADAGGNMNFFFLLPANTSVPIMTNIYPSGAMLFQPTNRFSFRAYSPAGYTISTNNIHLSLNGVDVSSNLVAVGTSTSWSVSYTGLKTNAAYTAVISVTDANANAAAITVNFDTFNPSFVWEGEDFDFNGGQFIDNPVLASTSQANSYFGQVGSQGVDENTLNNYGVSIASTSAQHAYRAGDIMGIGSAQDTARQNILTAQISDPGVQDYMLGWFNSGEWVNYTRTFPTGKYNVYVRAGFGNGGTSTLYLDQVTLGRTTAAQGTRSVGSFTIPSLGWTTYSYVPCVDAFGNLAEVSFSGDPSTLRVTAGVANLNFFVLVPARTDLPRVANLYPDGTTELQGTNNFSFTVMAATSPAVPVNPAGISVTLNGVGAPLKLTASGQNWNVTTPLYGNVSSYTAVVHVTDTASNSVSATVYFDTFNPGNLVIEAEDYDYGSGLFIDNPIPTSAPATGSYFGLNGADGVDYSYVSSDSSAWYLYRANDFIATDVTADTPLSKYVTARLADPTIKDYNVGWWAAGSWINYTRTCPAGSYNVFARLAGAASTTFTVQLATVNGGVATSQGAFSRLGRGYGAYDWVPLVQNGTNAVLHLSGVTTLQATTGGSANANRYMLVPAGGLPVTAAMSISSGAVRVAFSTQVGHSYTIEYKDKLTDTSWTPLASYVGDGTVQTPNVGAPAGSSRFYRVVTE